MHITLEADYATRMVYCLAKNGKRLDAKTLAEMSGVTLRFSLKILRKLVASGIIKSYKGIQGGYELAKPASEITLRQVVETIEGPFYINRCMDEDFVCTREKDEPCFFREVFIKASEMVRAEFDKITFDQFEEKS
ncbi:RrF2 family transcriptional regulator [Candidatus Soleaferrea massiliensis]|uniref:RrF2 family transcriptional regulator n=1 Tax=Candidatus Soleaferrea massiliensis TaxID=1470354 RepID=UPI00058E6556|nr:Rrf2 family transcriptional regulator [Candidatus Soleaferrea massiliensis]